MTYDQLVDFLQTQMRLSHIYQPLLIRTLVDSGGTATIRQLAEAFLSEDESQLMFYEKRIKQMPLQVLSDRGVLSRTGNLVTLSVGKLTIEQRANIKMLCEQRMQSYVAKKGLSIWDYRLLDNDPIPDSLYYRVIKEGKGRCAACGATRDERPLHVDHIVPRSKGGKTEYENLQVLCSKCNTTKGNKDKTDFRKVLDPPPDCRFCPDKLKGRIVEELGEVVAIKDGYPVTQEHHLVIPKQHTEDWFSMTENERQDAEKLLRILKGRIKDRDPNVTGFNVGMNCGDSAGQTIFHAHIHLIPRRDGDTAKPRGGVRGVIPGKMGY